MEKPEVSLAFSHESSFTCRVAFATTARHREGEKKFKKEKWEETESDLKHVIFCSKQLFSKLVTMNDRKNRLEFEEEEREEGENC